MAKLGKKPKHMILLEIARVTHKLNENDREAPVSLLAASNFTRQYQLLCCGARNNTSTSPSPPPRPRCVSWSKNSPAMELSGAARSGQGDGQQAATLQQETRMR